MMKQRPESNIASALQKKVEIITELNEKIFAVLEEEEIEVEIPESDEYIFNLVLNIQLVKRLNQTRTSRLNVHAASYLSDQNTTASNSTSTNAAVHFAASVTQKSGQQ